MARAQGIEPQSSGPEPDVVPLDHARTLNISILAHDRFINFSCQMIFPLTE